MNTSLLMLSAITALLGVSPLALAGSAGKCFTKDTFGFTSRAAFNEVFFIIEGTARSQKLLELFQEGRSVSLLESEVIVLERGRTEQWLKVKRPQSQQELWVHKKQVTCQDDEVAINRLKASAGSGNIDDQFELGLRYYEGDGLPLDYGKAFQWHLKAAERGHADAQVSVSFMYGSGRGIAKSQKEEFKWANRAAEQGSDMGQVLVGVAYYEGKGVAKDSHQSFKWYRKAAEQGNPVAQHALSLMYAYGDGIDQNFDESLNIHALCGRNQQ